MLFKSLAADVPDAQLPDDMTVAQFMLDSTNALRGAPPDGPWLIDSVSGRSYTVAEVKSRVTGLANALARRGVGEDDVVCIFSPNTIDYPVAVWACHRVGAIVSPANPSYTKSELVYQLELVAARLIITHPSSLKVAADAADEIGLTINAIVVNGRDAPHIYAQVEDLIQEGSREPPAYAERRLQPGEAKKKLAFLSFSSGTTGKPKAVAIPHYAPISNAVQIAAFNRKPDGTLGRYKPGQTTLAVLPMYHIYCLVVVLHASLFCGHRVVIMEKFEHEAMLKCIVEHRITHLYLVPPQIVLLCKHPATKKYDLSSVEYTMVGAAPLTADLQNKCQSLFPNMALTQGYGMTETCTVVTMAPYHWGNRAVTGCAGHMVCNTEARVVKPDGSLGGYGDTGELHVRGPQMALAYYKNEAATKETFEDGWVKTGDIVQIHENGDFFVVDRVKEFLKVGGFQVAPAELEGHILGHTDVADTPVAYVVLTPDAQDRAKRHADQTTASIMKFVADHKVKYKHLHAVKFIDAVPKTPSGKILRRVLRDRAHVDFGVIKSKL
ncbi:phenylacetyl-CoA ligase [Auriculariales sp. MPI-PUGE-AT-0066]|nr:phenylacetyl-CoA ligase [Auriculariales sp. MPI-PUGE-AT-0066]